MIAVIIGDIVASRQLSNQDQWLSPLKTLFSSWGDRPKKWELDRGDYFQVEITSPEEVLRKSFEIKALVKKVESFDHRKKLSSIDIRMAIGIGDKTYSGETIKESNGSAFIYAGEKFDLLKKENITLGIKTPWKEFDDDMNLYLKLSSIFMDKWTVSSAELIEIILNNPNITQEEIGKRLGIKQNSVSGRWTRAYVDELFEVEAIFRRKIKALSSC